MAALRGLRGGLPPFDGEREADHWVRLREVVRSLREQAGVGRADHAVDFAEQVVEVLCSAAQQVTGNAGELPELMQQALSAHALACRRSRPDPHRLASWLVRLQLNYPDGPEVALSEYAEALGPEGIAAYRRTARRACRELPTVPFGRTPRYDRRRWAVVRLMEELALYTGDVDVEVQWLATDLSTPWQYLRIATVLEDAGRTAEALAWVERGLVATQGSRAEVRLVDVAVDACLRLGKTTRALQLARNAFRDWPGLDTYLRLRTVADRADRWPAQREWARRWLRAQAEDTTRNSVLVQILMWDGEIDAAWRAATEHGCADHVWAALAEERVMRHPEQVLPVYRRLVRRRVAVGGAEHAAEVADLLDGLGLAWEKTADDGRAKFHRYLEELKRECAGDRALLTELARRGL
ncbi:hypothetical protein [Allokutzneria oryzae]|uniref:Tetratricopeptide repeat protein n=1 Tax=Allokutzneria oryzae TaxID=1378989 RepID=A0ABV5ZSJ0_9PSEU